MKLAAKKSFKEAGVTAFLSDVTESVPTPTDNVLIKLKINPAFQELIPSLSAEEYAQLEENLLENGIREAISIWGDTIIDGHNRYTLAIKHDLPFTTISYKFDNEDDVKLWIFKNQIGRRNLSPYERVKLALNLKPVIAEKAKEQQIRKSTNFVPQISAEQTPIDTRMVIADMAGVSHDTVSKVEKILDTATPEVLEKLKRGDVSINKAYQDTRLQERKRDVVALAAQSSPLLSPLGKFSVIYADCSLYLENLENGNKAKSAQYPVTSINELKKLEIPAEDDAVLLMWSTPPFLEKVLQVMNTWGFKYKTNMVWDKQLITTDQWIRGQHEILLIGVKGNFSLQTEDRSISSVYREEQGKHSMKTAYFYDQIERMFPGEKYLELFSKNKHSNLWEVWGSQLQLPESEGE